MDGEQPMSELLYTWAGRVSYQVACRWQEALAALRKDQQLPDVLLALEHPPTYTAGTRTLPEHLPSAKALATAGAVFHRSSRGGSVTFHGPGQLVGYPIVHLDAIGGDLHRYLRVLEEALLRTLAGWGIQAGRDPQYTGVWVGSAKIASIGVRVAKRVTMHGFALNLAPDLNAFRLITPCGITGRTVTSVAELGINPPSLAETAAAVARHLAVLLGHERTRPVSFAQLNMCSRLTTA